MSVRGPEPERMLYGRSQELARLGGVLESVRNHGSCVTIVTGEPGIGKTRLLAEFSSGERSHLKGEVFHSCARHDHDPQRDLELLLTPLLGAAATASCLERLAGIGVDAAGATTAAELLRARRSRIFGEITASLLEQLGAEPWLIVADDVQAGRPLLLGFLEFLVEELELRRREHRLLLVLITRILPPGHDVGKFIDQLERHDYVLRLDIKGLDEADEADMVRERLGGHVSRFFLDLVHRSARGNPLHVDATLRSLSNRGVAPTVGPADSRTWSQVRAPKALDDPVADWIGGLEARTRAVFGHAAVLGQEFDEVFLEAVSDVPRDIIAEELQHGLDIGLLETDGGAFWFAHAAYREPLLDGLSLKDRQRAHCQAGRRFAQSRANPVTAAAHFLQAGSAVPYQECLETYIEAANACAAATAWLEAAKFYEASLRVADETEASEPQLLGRIHLEAGSAYTFEPDYTAAQEHLRAAARIASQAGDEATWGRALTGLIRIASTTDSEALREPAHEAAADEFLASATSEALRSLVLQARAEAQVQAGRIATGMRTAEQAVELARTSDDPLAMAWAIYGQAFADMVAMRVRSSVERIREAQGYAQRAGDWFAESVLAARLPFPLMASGELAEAERAARKGSALAKASHDHADYALSACILAYVALLRGDVASAERMCRDAAEPARRSGYVLADLFLAPTLVLALVHGGRSDEAARVLETWPNVPRATRQAFRELIAASVGTDIESFAPLRPPRVITQISAGVFAARVETAVALGRADLLDGAAGLLEDWLRLGLEFSASYPGSLTRLAADVYALCDDPDAAVALYARANERCAAAGAVLEQARVLVGWAAAEATRAGGSSHRARSLATEALELSEPMGLAAVTRRARDLTRSLIDVPRAVAQRRGQWCVIMITDIVGSTRVSQRLGDLAYLELVLTHHDLVRGCLAKWGGTEFSEGGDSLLAWFPSTSDAVQAALEVQRKIAVERPHGLSVRVGLAGGEPLFHEGRPYGIVLNRAARVVARAGGGEIMTDEAVAAELAPGVDLLGSQEVDFKGIGRHTVSWLRRADAGNPSPKSEPTTSADRPL